MDTSLMNTAYSNELSNLASFQDINTLTSYIQEYFSQRLQSPVNIQYDQPQDNNNQRVLYISTNNICRFKVICAQTISLGIPNVTAPLIHWHLSKVIDLASNPLENSNSEILSLSNYIGYKRNAAGLQTIENVSKKMRTDDVNLSLSTPVPSSNALSMRTPLLAGNVNSANVVSNQMESFVSEPCASSNDISNIVKKEDPEGMFDDNIFYYVYSIHSMNKNYRFSS